MNNRGRIMAFFVLPTRLAGNLGGWHRLAFRSYATRANTWLLDVPVGHPSSTLLGRCQNGGEPVEGQRLGAQGAGAEDDGEHDLQFVQGLVEGHPGACAFGSVLIMVMKAWARTARVTWRCQPR